MSWPRKERNYIIHDDNNIKGFFGDYYFLSNFYKCTVKYDGLIYPSSENVYQAAKCINLDDKLLISKVDPASSKKIGQKVKLIDNWHTLKFGIMKNIVTAKFIQNSQLKIKFMETGDKYLEETNSWKDKTWGVCNGVGENHLGKILMEVRSSFLK
jgi:ribA/ribD-fused uncharacterized protein